MSEEVIRWQNRENALFSPKCAAGEDESLFSRKSCQMCVQLSPNKLSHSHRPARSSSRRRNSRKIWTTSSRPERTIFQMVLVVVVIQVVTLAILSQASSVPHPEVYSSSAGRNSQLSAGISQTYHDPQSGSGPISSSSSGNRVQHQQNINEEPPSWLPNSGRVEDYRSQQQQPYQGSGAGGGSESSAGSSPSAPESTTAVTPSVSGEGWSVVTTPVPTITYSPQFYSGRHFLPTARPVYEDYSGNAEEDDGIIPSNVNNDGWSQPDPGMKLHHSTSAPSQVSSSGGKKFLVTLVPKSTREGRLLSPPASWHALPAVATAGLISAIHPYIQQSLNISGNNARARTLQQVISYNAVVKPSSSGLVASVESGSNSIQEQYNGDDQDIASKNNKRPDYNDDYAWELDDEPLTADGADIYEYEDGKESNNNPGYNYPDYLDSQNNNNQNNNDNNKQVVDFPEGDDFLDFESPAFDQAEFRELYDGPKSDDEVYGSPSKPVVFKIASEQGPTHFVIRNPGADFLDPLFSKTAEGQDLDPDAKEYYQGIADMVTSHLGGSNNNNNQDEANGSTEYNEPDDASTLDLDAPEDDAYVQETVQIPAYTSLDGRSVILEGGETIIGNGRRKDDFVGGRVSGKGRRHALEEDEDEAFQTHVHIVHGPNDRKDFGWRFRERNLVVPASNEGDSTEPRRNRRINGPLQQRHFGRRPNFGNHQQQQQQRRFFQGPLPRVPKRTLEPPPLFPVRSFAPSGPQGPAFGRGRAQQQAPNSQEDFSDSGSGQQDPLFGGVSHASNEQLALSNPIIPKPVEPLPLDSADPSGHDAESSGDAVARPSILAPKLPTNFIPLKISGLPLPYARDAVKDITYTSTVIQPYFAEGTGDANSNLEANGQDFYLTDQNRALFQNYHDGYTNDLPQDNQSNQQQWRRTYSQPAQQQSFSSPEQQSFSASQQESFSAPQPQGFSVPDDQKGSNADPFTVLAPPNLGTTNEWSFG